MRRVKLAPMFASIFAVVLAGCTVGEDGAPDDELEMDDAPDGDGDGDGLVAQLQLGGFPARADFTNPPRFGGTDKVITNEVIRLIDGAQPASQIRAALHSITLPGVLNALLRAQNERGVDVAVVHDGGDDSPAAVALRTGLAAGKHTRCGHGGGHGCITRSATGLMHTKLFLFSRTLDGAGAARDDVAWIGSANMTGATGQDSFNNAVTVYGDRALYTQLDAYFGALVAQRDYAGNDYFDAASGRGYVVAPSGRVYASPEAAADGDLIVKRLADIVPDADCRIRVAQNMIHDGRAAVVDRLVELRGKQRNKCKIWVVSKGDGDGDKIDARQLAKLRAAGIPVRLARVHDKYLAIKARLAGSPDTRYLVLTGSHNLTSSAQSKNDELLVRYDSKPLYDAFWTHFRHAYEAGVKP